jgi:hypothetical protein
MAYIEKEVKKIRKYVRVGGVEVAIEALIQECTLESGETNLKYVVNRLDLDFIPVSDCPVVTTIKVNYDADSEALKELGKLFFEVAEELEIAEEAWKVLNK